MRENYSREELLKIAHSRLYPSITSPSYLVQRRRRQILGRWIDDIPGDQLSVLDVGGRYQPYRPLLGNRLGRYVAVDILSTELVDVVASGAQLPFKDDSFDIVIATTVFEFFPEPRVAALEIHRVLRPGGFLLLSVAALYPRVNDGEHWRFTPTGLKFVLSPFARVDIVPEVASIGGFFRVNAVSLSIMAKYGWMRSIIHHTLVPLLNICGVALDRQAFSSNDQIAGNFCALAQKMGPVCTDAGLR